MLLCLLYDLTSSSPEEQLTGTQMDRSNSSFNYEQAVESLSAAGVTSTIGEIHGLLCGLLCSTVGDVRQQWLEEIFANEEIDDKLLADCREPLANLYNDCLSELQSFGMDFAPLLPDEESPIGHRTQELAHWCQGFLYGIGLGGEKQQEKLSQEAKEALKDVAEIARINAESMEESEENEEDLFELEEFVRVAMLLTFSDLGEEREADSATH